MKPAGSSLPLLTIAILVVLLQQRIPSIPPALALRGLDETWQLRNGSSPIDSNSTSTYLPDPANCDPPQTTQMGTFFFANSSTEEQLHGADAVKQPRLASNFSESRNSTHKPCAILNGNVSDCGNASSTTEHNIPLPEQNQAVDMKSYMVVHVDEGALAHVEEDAPLYEIASMHVVVQGKDDVLLVNKEGSTSTPIHITDDPSSAVTDSVQVMVINDDDVVLVDDAQLRNIATAPATHIRAQAASQSSLAKDSVQIMEVGKDDVVFINVEQLGGPTPPPGSPSIHTAAGSSIARESVQVMDLGKGDVLWINEEQLAGSTAPPGDTSIHTAAQSSVAKESVQVMVIDEDDVVSANVEQLGRYTPPPMDTSIHKAGERSAARESMAQVIKMSADGVKEERLGASTPPPGGSDINSASQSSVARDSSFPGSFQHGESQHDQSY